MQKLMVALICTVIILIAPVTPAHAQNCQAGALTQFDMAGVYVDPASPMRVEIYPCGGVYLQWDNVYGTHRAIYYGTVRAPGGGFAAAGVRAEPLGVFLDDSHRIGFKPAEPGYIQVVTLGVYDETFRVYRLKKIA